MKISHSNPEREDVSTAKSGWGQAGPHGKCREWIQVALLMGLVAVIIFVVFRDYLVGDRLFLFSRVGSDTYYQYWPENRYFGELVRSCHFPQWIFGMGLGSQINLPRICLNPFLLFLYLIPSQYDALALVYKAALEYLAATLVWWFYLRKLGVAPTGRIIFSLFWGFNGYITLWGQHDIFGLIFTMVPLTLYAFEWLVKEERCWPLALALTFFLSSAYYFFYMFSVFFLFFSAVRYFSEVPWTWRRCLKLYLKVAGCYAIAVLLSAWVILPTAMYLATSPRIGALPHPFPLGFYPPHVYISAIFRLFSNNVFGADIWYRGPEDYYSTPQLYCGLLALVVAPQIFRHVSSREKVALSAGVILTLLCIASPFLAFIFNGCSTLTHRHTFIVITFALYVAARAFNLIERSGSIDRRLLAVTCVLLAALAMVTLVTGPLITRSVISLPQSARDTFLKLMQAVVPSATAADLDFTLKRELLPTMMREMGKVLLFLTGYTILLWAYSPHSKRRINILLITLGVCELIVFTYPTVNNRVTIGKAYLQRREGYYDHTLEALDQIRNGAPAFYRVSKTYNSVFLNDGLFQGYYGTKGYCSVQEPSYLYFLEQMDILPFLPGRPKFIGGFGDRYMLNTLVGVKYVLSKTPIGWPGHTRVGKANDIMIYKNECALPLGFVYHAYVDPGDFRKLPGFAKDLCLLRAFVASATEQQKKGFRRIPTLELGRDLAGSEMGQGIDKVYKQSVEELRRESFEIASFSEDRIAGRVTLASDGLLFLSIPYNKGWRVEVDGKPAQLRMINMGFLGLELVKGMHQVALTFVAPGSRIGLGVTGTALTGLMAFYFIRRLLQRSGNLHL